MVKQSSRLLLALSLCFCPAVAWVQELEVILDAKEFAPESEVTISVGPALKDGKPFVIPKTYKNPLSRYVACITGPPDTALGPPTVSQPIPPTMPRPDIYCNLPPQRKVFHHLSQPPEKVASLVAGTVKTHTYADRLKLPKDPRGTAFEKPGGTDLWIIVRLGQGSTDPSGSNKTLFGTAFLQFICTPATSEGSEDCKYKVMN